MTKISKNIKKIRQEKGLTQQALADRLNITRQALSSWETGRTQPDLSMLEALSKVLEVEIEQLLYGEKRNTALDNTERSYKSTVTVIVSILGSLLTAVGLILIFVTGWQKLPFAVKGFFAFVPALLGQGAAAFVLFKKRESVAYCEGVSLLWSTGVMATLALVNGIFSVDIGFENCLMLDSLMLLPILFLLDAVSPLVIYYYMALHYGFYSMDFGPSSRLLISVLLLAAGFVFVGIRKKALGAVRFAYCEWLSVAAAIILLVMIGSFFESNFVLAVLTLSVALGLMDRKDSLASPYTWLGLLGVPATGFFFVFAGEDLISHLRLPEIVLEYLLYAAIYIAAAVLVRKPIRKRTLKRAQLVCFTLIFLSAFIQSAILSLNYAFIESFGFDEADIVPVIEVGRPFLIVMLSLIFASGMIAILQGAKENRLFPINIGFLTICGVLLSALLRLETGLLVNGLVLLVMGVILLSVNLSVMKKKEQRTLVEVTENEAE